MWAWRKKQSWFWACEPDEVNGMIDEYYRNGELFLAEMEKKRDEEKYFEAIDKIVPTLKGIINDDYIKENYREPIKELLGSANVSDKSTDRVLLKGLRKYFEISGKSIGSGRLLPTFFKTKQGACSYCGRKNEVFPHVSYIFPFFRKIDSITPDSNKPNFCKGCGFMLYSGMAYLYQKGNLKFFFDSYDHKNIRKISIPFKEELRDPSNSNKIRKLGVPTFHPHETMFVTLFECTKFWARKNLLKDVQDFVGKVRLVMAAGRGQIYSYRYVEGDVLDKLTEFFTKLIEESKAIYKVKTEKERPKKIAPEDLIFSRFFGNLTVNKGDFEENCRLREEFTKSLLSEKINHIAANEIIMERLKKGEIFPIPPYYRFFLKSFMEVFNMEKEKDMFEKINGLGYALGTQMKGTNLENFVWNIFRARGQEELYSSIVELQTKLQTSIDLRTINEYEKEWKKTKAILLNGILNALYGGGKK